MHLPGRAVLLLLAAATALPAQGHAAPAAELWPMWQSDAPDNTATIDHAAWQRFLDRYLTTGQDGVNRVAYSRVSDRDRALLQEYLQTLAGLDPRDYAKAEQLPYWINLYNALTVEVVLQNPRKSSILRMGGGLFPTGPWDDEVTTVAGQPITLNDIEHRILRPIWQDHRIHYAVNCASMSCPNLAPQAYTKDNTATLLTAGEAAYVNHPRGVRLDATGRLVLSRIYDWYASDFAEDRAGLLAHLGERHQTRGAEIAAYQGRIKFAYDWSLNQTEDER